MSLVHKISFVLPYGLAVGGESTPQCSVKVLKKMVPGPEWLMVCVKSRHAVKTFRAQLRIPAREVGKHS